MNFYRYTSRILYLAALALITVSCTRTAGNSAAVDPAAWAPDSPATLPAAIETATPESVAPTPAPEETASPTATQLIPTFTFTPSATPPQEVNLMAVGDIMLGRTVGERMKKEGSSTPFMKVIATLNRADILVGNLECAVTTSEDPVKKSYNFQAPLSSAEGLALAGFDMVSMANNHALDYGPAALPETLDTLKKQNVAIIGAGLNARTARTPFIKEVNGLRVAFLAYVDVPIEGKHAFDTRDWIAGDNTPGLAWADSKDMRADIKEAKKQADLVVVLLHAGREDTARVEGLQKELSHRLIDYGATLVLGSHSHVLQVTEKYEGGLIVYSLGNFVFDDFGFPENYSAIFSAKLTPAGVASYEFIPVVIEDGFPRPAKGDEIDVIYQMTKTIN